jgi:hemerythrin-like domain-containing protein
MNPYIRKLVSEHEHGLVQLGFLDDATQRIVERGFSEEDLGMIKKSVEFISKEIREHNENEEKNLFPLMENHLTQSGPTYIMRSEHRILWGKMDLLMNCVNSVESDKMNKSNFIKLRENALEIINLLKEHINKENSVLFPMAERVLSKPELKSLADLV